MKTMAVVAMAVLVMGASDAALAGQHTEGQIFKSIAGAVLRDESNTQKGCESYAQAQRDYQLFQSPTRTGYESVPGTGMSKAAAEQELYGKQIEANWQRTQQMVPSGYNAMTCSGSYPTGGGSYTFARGKIVRESEILSDGTNYEAIYGANDKFPMVVTRSIGPNKLTVRVPAPGELPLILEADFSFFRVDPTRNEYILPDGKTSISKNIYLEALNKIYRECAFEATTADGRATGNCLSTADYLRLLSGNESAQAAILGAISKEVLSTHPEQQPTPTKKSRKVKR